MTLVGENLTCIRGERPVFAGLSFEIAPGGALLLRGPNGAGKSSLLRIAATLLKPADGRLLWHGQPAADDIEAYRGALEYVGHLDAVKPVLTVSENVAFWTHLRGRGDVQAALERFGVAHLAEVPAGMLSAGQRKRAALARLLTSSTRLWLLDEPTVSLDTDGVAALEAAIAAHRAGGGMVMLATHVDLDLPDAAALRLGRRAAA